jgi:hypothetical protein
MADLVVVPANVLPLTGARRRYATAGETFTAGQAVYRNRADRQLYKADANLTQAAASAVGIATTAGVPGQTAEYVDRGQVVLGVAVAPGVPFVVSATPGGVAPATDLATGWYTSLLGVGAGGQILDVRPFASGYLHG